MRDDASQTAGKAQAIAAHKPAHDKEARSDSDEISLDEVEHIAIQTPTDFGAAEAVKTVNA